MLNLIIHIHNLPTAQLQATMHLRTNFCIYFISHCCRSFKEKRKLCGSVWFFGVLMIGLSQPFTSRDLFRTVADLISWSLFTTASSRSGNDNNVFFTISLVTAITWESVDCILSKVSRDVAENLVYISSWLWPTMRKLRRIYDIANAPFPNEYVHLTEDFHFNQIWEEGQNVLVLVLPSCVIQIPKPYCRTGNTHQIGANPHNAKKNRAITCDL